MLSHITTAAAALLLTTGAHAQIALTEVFENPPNGGDEQWEYIEIYGPPGMSLTGYAVVLVKGGEDADPPFGVPDGSDMHKASEIDEAFSLDGWTIGPNGQFVIYGVTSFGATGMTGRLTPNPSYQFFLPESRTNKRFLDGASFNALHIPSVDTPSKLENDGSSTYVIVRRRPGHVLSATGASVYGPQYAWKKDVTPDVDYNGRLDFGDEHLLGVPIYLARGLGDTQTTALMMEPVQVIDEICWSNTGGKEYGVPGRGRLSGEISETPGFNPDAVSRVRYSGGNLPAVQGSTISNEGVLLPRSTADEDWIYGETRDYAIGSAPDSDDLEPGAPGFLQFRPELYDVRTGRQELNWLAPTNPNGNRYSYAGPGSPNPLAPPFFEQTGALDPGNGTLLFEPYPITGFELTPGGFNDAPAAATGLTGSAIERQFRFIRGDFNFDSTVDCADRNLLVQAAGEGWTLDDTTTLVDNRNTETTADDRPYIGYARQLESFNATLAMIRMSLTDGSTGEWTSGQVIDSVMGSPTFGRIIAWGGSVTAQDLAAFEAEFPDACDEPCLADFNGSGAATVQDIFDYLAAYFSNQPSADFNGSGSVTVQDIFDFLSAYFTGCA